MTSYDLLLFTPLISISISIINPLLRKVGHGTLRKQWTNHCEALLTEKVEGILLLIITRQSREPNRPNSMASPMPIIWS
jgi:hypothetical protein